MGTSVALKRQLIRKVSVGESTSRLYSPKTIVRIRFEDESLQ